MMNREEIIKKWERLGFLDESIYESIRLMKIRERRQKIEKIKDRLNELHNR